MNNSPQVPNRLTAEEDGDLIDLSAIFGTLWRGKWWILFAAIGCMYIGSYYLKNIATPLYTATTELILETRQNDLVSFQSAIRDLGANPFDLASEVEVLTSRSLMGRVVNELNLTEDPEFNRSLLPPSNRTIVTRMIRAVLADPQAVLSGELPDVRAPTVSNLPPEEIERRAYEGAINRLIGKSTIRNLPLTFVYNIVVESEDPEKAALLADTIAEVYIRDQIEIKFEVTEQATTWLTGRVADLQLQLEAAESEAADFSSSIDLVSADALRAQEVQLKDTRDRVASEEAALADRRVFLDALKAAVTREEQANVAEDIQLRRLLLDLQTDQNSAQEFDQRFSQLVVGAERDILRLQQQVNLLRQSQKSQEEQINRQSSDLIRLQQFNREAEAVRLLYEYFLGRLQETTAQAGIQRADSRVLSPAVIPLGPSSPRRSLVRLFSIVFGVLLGASWVLFREMRQTGFRSAQDLERFTAHNVLGQIPRIPARNRKKTVAYLRDKPASAAAEAYRNLRTSLMLSNVDNPPQVIVSTSCVPGEGKTTNSLALAQNLTGLGKKVLLVEGDIRRRTFAQYFKNIPEKGLVSVLSGEVELDEALVDDDTLNASILAGDRTKANAADIFASEKFKDLITEMRELYDVIIIDTPPVLVVPDARIIAESADALLFTVQWDKTPKAQVAEAMRMLQSSGQNITGFVLSQINAKRMKAYGYGGRYGAYAGYGAQYYKN